MILLSFLTAGLIGFGVLVLLESRAAGPSGRSVTWRCALAFGLGLSMSALLYALWIWAIPKTPNRAFVTFECMLSVFAVHFAWTRTPLTRHAKTNGAAFAMHAAVLLSLAVVTVTMSGRIPVSSTAMSGGDYAMYFSLVQRAWVYLGSQEASAYAPLRVGSLLIAIAGLAGTIGPLRGLLVAIGMVALFMPSDGLPVLLVEAPLTLCLLLATGSLVNYVRAEGGSASTFLSGWFLGVLGWMNVVGVVYAGLLCAITIVAIGLSSSRAQLKGLPILFAGAAVPLTVSGFFRSPWGGPEDPYFGPGVLNGLLASQVAVHVLPSLLLIVFMLLGPRESQAEPTPPAN